MRHEQRGVKDDLWSTFVKKEEAKEKKGFLRRKGEEGFSYNHEISGLKASAFARMHRASANRHNA